MRLPAAWVTHSRLAGFSRLPAPDNPPMTNQAPQL